MVGTIGFAGSKARARNRLRWWARVIGGPHIVAAAVGGAATGLLASVAGLALPSGGDARVSIGVALLVAAGVFEALGVRANLVARAKQVPLSWKHVFPAPMSSTLYGLVLGLGVATTVYFWSFWSVVLALVLVADPVLGLLIGSAYGVGRAAPVIASATLLDEADVMPAIERWERRGALVRILSLTATALLTLGLWQIL